MIRDKAITRQRNGQPREPLQDTGQGGTQGGARPVHVGRHAHAPSQIPWKGWKQVLRRTFSEMISDRIGLAAGGCAFYATLALSPAISMLVSVYGLAFDPQTVEPQMRVLKHLLPGPAYSLIADRVHVLVSKDPGTLTISLIVSV